MSISSPYLAMTAPSACSSGGPGWAGGRRGAISAKYRSKPAGEMISKRPRRRVSRVPEGVRDASGLEDEIPGPGDADLVPDLDADLTLEHVGVLVLALVRVHRRGEDARFDRMLDERDGPTALSALDHEPHAEPAELHPLTLVR
jgi:hypothetical protein